MNTGHLDWIGNVASATAIVGSFLGMAPPAAAVMAFIWYATQIYESKTFQAWVRDRQTRKLARLKARALMLEAKMAHPIEPNVLEDGPGKS